MSHLSIVGQDVYHDLELFTAYSNKYQDTIMYIIDDCLINTSCKQYIIHKLKHPNYNIKQLRSNQEKLHNTVLTYQNNIDETNSIVRCIQNNEKDIKWLFDHSKDEIIDILDIVYFQMDVFERIGLNKSSELLVIKNVYTILLAPLISLFSPLMYIIVPYFIIVYKLKFKIPIGVFFKTFTKALIQSYAFRKVFILQCITLGLSVFMYFQTVLNTFELAKNNYKVLTHILDKINNIISYIDACERIKSIYNISDSDTISDVRNIIEKCKSLPYHFGYKLWFFRNIDLIKLNKYFNIFDIFFSELTLAKVFTKYKMCLTEFVISEDIHINATNTFHISIKNPIPNTIHLNKSNCIITGPNAAGKSTFIKGLLLNILFSQTYGIACADTFSLTPFYFINSQINIPDCKGKQSLFEAEMFRCKQYLDIVSQLPMHLKSINFMDEVFSSTNVVEGVSGAFGILQKLSTFTNVCAVVTTHLLYLTKLKSFVKYKMNVNINEDDGTITFPYKLEKGNSKQLVAIELIKNNFDSDVIETALKIKKKLLV
tara:strand:+ start:1559 stop:3184 length:1626 start_codon:yes stop_codon:yes gene_type:complete